MSRSSWFPLFASLTVLAVGSTPAWAQHRGGNGGGWPPAPHGGRNEPSQPPPGPQGGRDPRSAPPSMEASVRPRPGASDCGRSMALSPGDQILAVQPVDSSGGRVQCRIKVMGADGMVRVMMVSPGF